MLGTAGHHAAVTKIRSSSTGRVRDVRGAGGGISLGGRGGGLGLPIGAGGGVIGLLVLLAVVVLPQLTGGGGGTSPAAPSPRAGGGAVACESELEQIVCGAVDDVHEYWERQYPLTFEGQYPGTDTVFFSGGVQTGCGRASASIGPFYCPADQLVYFDLDVLDQLQREFGAMGDLAAQYIVAHEYGHHVQNVTGIMDITRDRQARNPDRANELGVALELQADCFAGAWASSVAERGLFDEPGEIDEALRAAEAVGDDRIQARSGGEVDPDSFTHGSAEQRRSWFELGFQTGDPGQCRTFGESLAP